MAFLVSVPVPFPNISWWAFASNTDEILFDINGHFEKMSYRNRYCIAGANGVITLSIPLQQGRNQRIPLKDVLISNKENWQTQHWRTITSAYRRTPYFEHYEHLLQPLFEQPFERLVDFNFAAIHWLKRQLKTDFTEQIADHFQKEYNDAAFDIRQKQKPATEEKFTVDYPKYYQLFEDRIGFQPNLSMLDLLFAEGPYAAQWVKKNAPLLML
ncbi:WbqC family protein [Taibaiella soli]|uniref:WbqC family protein n=1 Tax=Taibaiella soli TaxID=1649169 RepID=A0A2W2AXM3_9BACT|nr:WbqC family protein [Taibaiella soli]PZF72418.1 hypothetical protein DN068_13785 [Taibaiella soli]